MARNLDLTALRSFVTVAETGGVTRAAQQLNLTQSAVSMQLKRLEESLDLGLMDRSGRNIGLTTEGEQLLSYARRMLELNDEALGRLTAKEFEGELVLGVPHDIVYPTIPAILRQFALDFPRMQVRLISSYTRSLKEQYAKGEIDVMLTTEYETGPGGKALREVPLIWVGAPVGQAWKQRPLRLAHEAQCIFRQLTQRKLDETGIEWVMAIDTDSTRSSEATVSADLAVHTMLEGTEPQQFERIDHGGALPDLGSMYINMYIHAQRPNGPTDALSTMLERGFTAL